MAKRVDKRKGKLLRLADALLEAASAVYDADDAFTCDSSRQTADERRARDRALGEALIAYRTKRS